MTGLGQVYSIDSPAAAEAYYDNWASDYDAELESGGYITPQRCANALAEFANLPWAPLLDIGCGTGLSGTALRNAGFECLDGLDLSDEMLAQAGEKEIYRSLGTADLSQPLDDVPGDIYQNAAAIGVLNPMHIPVTAIDQILGKLPSGGCFVMSLNDHALADGTMETRVLELTEHAAADLMFKEHGPHIPEIGLESTVYVLKKR